MSVRLGESNRIILRAKHALERGGLTPLSIAINRKERIERKDMPYSTHLGQL